MKKLIPLVCILLAGCVGKSAKHTSAEAPPEHTRWVKSYTVTEFDEAVRREDEAALATAARGAFHVRWYPTPKHWAEVKARHPRSRSIWRFEPDGSAPSAPEAPRRMGPGFAIIDEAGRLVVFHQGSGYAVTRSK